MTTSGEWLDEREQRLWRSWLQVHAELGLALQRQLQESGLSSADHAVLVHLSEVPEGQMHVSELAELLHWERSRLSHQLTRMERRNQIRRVVCPTDRRGAHVALTPAGRATIDQVAPGHVAAVRSLVFDRLSVEQQQHLSEILATLAVEAAAVS